jgi:hypothetical protein
MNKKLTTVSAFLAYEKAKELYLKAYDGEGQGDGDGHQTGDGEAEFSEDSIPENLRESFTKFKQTLIDKGVNIGTARSRESFEKGRSKRIEKFLEEEGYTLSDLKDMKKYLGQKDAMKEILEAYEVEDFGEVAKLVKQALQDDGNGGGEGDGNKPAQVNIEDNEDYKKLKKANADFQAQIDSLRKSLEDQKSETKKHETALTDYISKHTIDNAIVNAAKEAGAYDPEDLLYRLRKSVELVKSEDGEDFIPVVVDSKGTRRYDSNGDPVTIATLVNEFLEKRPHLKKSEVKSGPGSSTTTTQPKPQGQSTGKFTKEQLRDPKFFQEHYQEIMDEVRNGRIKL